MTDYHWKCKGCGVCLAAEWRRELVLIGEQFYHLSGDRLDGGKETSRELEFTDTDGSKYFAYVCGPMIFKFEPTKDPIVRLDRTVSVPDKSIKVRPAAGAAGIRGSGRSIQTMKIKIPKDKTRRLELDD